MLHKSKRLVFRKVAAAMLSVIPLLIPFCIWMALNNYKPAVADVCALASGLIVLLVYILYLQTCVSFGLEKSKLIIKELDKLRNDLDNLKLQKPVSEQITSKLTSQSASIPVKKTPYTREANPEAKPQKLTEQHSESSNLKVSSEPLLPKFSDSDLQTFVQKKYLEMLGLPQVNAERLVAGLAEQLEIIENGLEISIIYRDSAVENSKVYRLQRNQAQIPSVNIAVFFPSEIALLFPAPVSGQDCFHDAKGFTSSTAPPLQKRSKLVYCLPAKLESSEQGVFDLTELGTLDFNP